MKTYRNGTTTRQWDVYYSRLEEHEKYMWSIKPIREEFDNEEKFKVAMTAWEMKDACERPNKPGYLYANND